MRRKEPSVKKGPVDSSTPHLREQDKIEWAQHDLPILWNLSSLNRSPQKSNQADYFIQSKVKDWSHRLESSYMIMREEKLEEKLESRMNYEASRPCVCGGSNWIWEVNNQPNPPRLQPIKSTNTEPSITTGNIN